MEPDEKTDITPGMPPEIMSAEAIEFVNAYCQVAFRMAHLFFVPDFSADDLQQEIFAELLEDLRQRKVESSYRIGFGITNCRERLILRRVVDRVIKRHKYDVKKRKELSETLGEQLLSAKPEVRSSMFDIQPLLDDTEKLIFAERMANATFDEISKKTGIPRTTIVRRWDDLVDKLRRRLSKLLMRIE